MATTIQRPSKTGGNREFAIERANGFITIRSAEVDADFDTLYTAWNSGLIPGIVTISATAPPSPVPGQLWWRNDPDGNLFISYNDGTSTQWVPAMVSATPHYYLVAGALAGVPTASLSVGLYVAAVAFTLPAGLAGSQAVAKGAATGAASFPVQVNGTAKGSINWAAAATVATFTWAADVAIATGDRIEVLAPATPDTTLSDPAWTLRGMF